MVDAMEPIMVPPVLKAIVDQAPGVQLESISGPIASTS